MSEATARLTLHYRRRRVERALRRDVEAFVMTYGTERRARGATHLTIVRGDLPLDLRDAEITDRATGWIVIEADDGSRLTCYRRDDAWKYVRRKSEASGRRHGRRR